MVKNYATVASELAGAAKDYGDTVEKVTRTGKIGQQINTLLDATTTALIIAADGAKAQASAQTTRASRIDLGIGLFVIVVLAGVAMFGALAISRPIHHIGDVLLQLAAGNKNVAVPYLGRGDEVGANARAAQTFKEKLVRIDQLGSRGTREYAARGRAAQGRHARWPVHESP